MAQERFAYVWRYEVDPELRREFLAAYNPAGEWVQLFSRDPAYIETKLLQDVDDDNVFVTIDYWKSKAQRDLFRERFARAFDSLDNKCETFTRHEQFLGDYTEVLA